MGVETFSQYVRPQVEFSTPVWSPWLEKDRIVGKGQEKAVKMITVLTVLRGHKRSVACKDSHGPPSWLAQIKMHDNSESQDPPQIILYLLQYFRYLQTPCGVRNLRFSKSDRFFPYFFAISNPFIHHFRTVSQYKTGRRPRRNCHQ